MSMLRCPFCHEGISQASSRWVACASCLARRHEPCFGEGGACASCGHAEALDPLLAQSYRRATSRVDQRRRLVRGAVGFAVLAALEAGLGLALGWPPVLYRVGLVVLALALVVAVALAGAVLLALLLSLPILALERRRARRKRSAEPARSPGAPEKSERSHAKRSHEKGWWQSDRGEVSVAPRSP